MSTSIPYRLGGENRMAIYPDNMPSASAAILRPDSSLSVYRVFWRTQNCLGRWDRNQCQFSFWPETWSRATKSGLQVGGRSARTSENVAESGKPDVSNSLPSANHSFSFYATFFFPSKHLGLVRFLLLYLGIRAAMAYTQVPLAIGIFW